MRIEKPSPSSSAHDTTYFRNSRASGSCSALAVSALADSAFADSAFADSAFADSAFADSAFADSAFADSALSIVIADWTVSVSSTASPQPIVAVIARVARPRAKHRPDRLRNMIEASAPQSCTLANLREFLNLFNVCLLTHFYATNHD